MAVPLPRRGRFWRSTSAPIVPAMNIAVPPLILAGIPCLSLWERWPSAARTERVNNDHLVLLFKKAARPSQSPAVTALPKGEPRVPFRYVLPLRPLFLQCRTPYRASSTAYGGPPSPKGKVLVRTFTPYRKTRAPKARYKSFPRGKLARLGEPDEGCGAA